ncbi:MAG: LacI family DNA-binding transcriptional regulator, partial [Phycisphaeraceae bacterium]|nr:LacI family DNA-binding transcriptional regulator [Phycisphaeraceae bacterium]
MRTKEYLYCIEPVNDVNNNLEGPMEEDDPDNALQGEGKRPTPPSSQSTISVRDIARMCHVSASTVSNVVNGHRSVAVATAARVREAMDKTNYRPQTKAVITNRALLLIPTSPAALFSEHLGSLYCSVTQAAMEAGLCLSIRK